MERLICCIILFCKITGILIHVNSVDEQALRLDVISSNNNIVLYVIIMLNRGPLKNFSCIPLRKLSCFLTN